jgi:hypothetical protein
MASGVTFGKTIRKRMALPPAISLSFLILPVLPLIEQSQKTRTLDKTACCVLSYLYEQPNKFEAEENLDPPGG